MKVVNCFCLNYICECVCVWVSLCISLFVYVLWQPGLGQLRTCRAPEEQVEKRGLNSLLLRSFGALPAMELLYERPVLVGDETVDSSQVFSLL